MTLKYTIEAIVEECDGIRPAARYLGVNPGIVYNVLQGGDSPTLRRIWKIPKHPKRPRLIVRCTQETIERYDAQRGDMSRREWLERLIDLGDGLEEVAG